MLSLAAFRLFALGRLKDAIGPFSASLQRNVADRDWINAAIDAECLSQVRLGLGCIADAIDAGRRAVDLADNSRIPLRRIISRAVLADALHQAGSNSDVAEAERLFQEAEVLQEQWQNWYPKLYELQGYRYNDLLLARGAAELVLDRAAQTLQWAQKEQVSLLSAALDRLALGRAHLHVRHDGRAKRYLDQSLAGLRDAGHQWFVVLGLLARADFFMLTDELALAQTDLAEALEIATRGDMRLYVADAHLGYARLAHAENQVDEAREHLGQAKALVSHCGYHRRGREVAGLEKALGVTE